MIGTRIRIPQGMRYEDETAVVVGQRQQPALPSGPESEPVWVLRVEAPGEEWDGEETSISDGYLRDAERI